MSEFPGAQMCKQELQNIIKAPLADPKAPIAKTAAVSEQVFHEYEKLLAFQKHCVFEFQELSAFFNRDNVGLHGFGQYFKALTKIEEQKVMAVTAFLQKRGQYPKPMSIQPPPLELPHPEISDAVYAFAKTLAADKTAFCILNEIAINAMKEGDASGHAFAMEAQCIEAECIKKHAYAVSHLKAVHKDKNAIWQFSMLKGAAAAEAFKAVVPEIMKEYTWDWESTLKPVWVASTHKALPGLKELLSIK